jgi:hypothetical protein
LFTKIDRGHYVVREEAQSMLALPEQGGYRRSTLPISREAFRFGNATLIHGDCFEWLANAPTNSKNYGKAAVACGGFRLRLMETSDLHSRVLPFFRATM